MTNDRPQSSIEVQTAREARVMELLARGYAQVEVARELEISKQQLGRILARIKKRIPAENTKQWRQVQLLRLERLLEACQAVLAAHHVVVSNGSIVTRKVFGDDGQPIWVSVYGPTGEVLLGPDGQPLVEQKREPLEDHAAVLEAVAEMRKIEVEIAKLLGTPVAVKQEVEVQHVNYTIEGVDMGKVLGADKATQ